MVPGFGGFDALGQLQYYSGVTQLMSGWLDDHPGTRAAVHYFDNLPTAAVATRGARLARYVKKLVERRVIDGKDKVVLVGHSTGGLDIRQMLRDLNEAATDGASPATTRANPLDSREQDRARAAELLERIDRLVFLSVPHHGTNIADLACAHPVLRKVAIGLFQRAFEERIPLTALLELLPMGWLAPGHSELADAFEDARSELNPTDPTPIQLADAREARADISLWLAHSGADFMAISDLAVEGRPDRIVATPNKDRQIWNDWKIKTRSYATIGKCPFDPTKLKADAANLASGFELGRALHADIENTDAIYRVAYRACAGGPFDREISLPYLGGEALRAVERWENDGIVNTASMVPPDGELPFLVEADHGDVLGHYRHEDSERAGRKREAYDLLGSGPGFNHTKFADLWNDAFAFAFSP
jgi:pimeloyl-ACP methyl ester carboxylesterase